MKLDVGREVTVYRWWQDPTTHEYRWMTGTIESVGARIVVKLENGKVEAFARKDLAIGPSFK